MTTVATRPETHTQAGGSNRHGSCDGCPRCQDANAVYCTSYHQRFGGRHPVCKRCGHCVLRGSHQDDTSDLDRHPGFNPDAAHAPSIN